MVRHIFPSHRLAHVRESKTFFDSGFHKLDSKAGDSGFDNSNCLVSGFHKQNFAGFPYLERNRCSLTLHASASFKLFSYR